MAGDPQAFRGARKGRALVVALTVAAALAAPMAAGGRDSFLASFQDDAFYYFTIARNLAQGIGSTFDGVHATNGYHPLWLLLLVPIQWATSGSWTPIVVAAALEILLLAIAAALIFGGVAPIAGARSALAAALAPAAWPWTAANLRCGMEGALAFLAVVVAWRAWNRARRSREASVGAWLVFGTACALAFLARLEAIALTVAALVVAAPIWRPRPRIAVAIVAPSAATLSVYALANWAWFGAPVPLSGAVKAWYAARSGLGSRLLHLPDFPWPGRDVLVRLAGSGGVPEGAFWLEGGHLLLMVATAALAWRFRSRWSAAAGALGLSWFGIAALLWTAADKAVVSHVEPWNRAHFALFTSLVLAALLAATPRLARWVVVSLLLLAAAAVPMVALRGSPERFSFAPWRLAAARWISAHVPPGSPVGSWNAGMIGWFSGRSVVNLDGLVNDREFFREVLRGGRLENYLDETGIAWLADQTCGADPTPAPYLRRMRAESLAPRVRLVAVFASDARADGCPAVAVWRVEGAGRAPERRRDPGARP